jgi:hypothetical protein
LQQLFQPVGGQTQTRKQLSPETWISPNGHEQLWNIDPFHSPALAHRIRRLQQLLQVFADEKIRPSPRRLISQYILEAVQQLIHHQGQAFHPSATGWIREQHLNQMLHIE